MFECDIKISHFAVLLRSGIEGKKRKRYIFFTFWINRCSKSSLEVLKIDRTFWISLLTLPRAKMNDGQN